MENIVKQIEEASEAPDTSDGRRKRLDSTVALSEFQLTELAKLREMLQVVYEGLKVVNQHAPVKPEQLLAVVDHEAVRNVMELSALFKAESACLIGDYWCSTGFRKRLYARTLALVTLETTRTLRGLLGAAFRGAVVLRLGSGVEKDLKQIHRDVTDVFETANRDFGELRNEVVGHRSANAQKRYALLSSADSEAIVQNAVNLHPILTSLFELLREYIDLSYVELRQFRDSIDMALTNAILPSDTNAGVT